MTGDIGARIAADQAAGGLVDRALAKAAGVSAGYLSRVRSGAVKRPGPDALIAIAEALGQDPDEYLALAGYGARRRGGSVSDELERLTAAIERLTELVEERLPDAGTTPRRDPRG